MKVGYCSAGCSSDRAFNPIAYSEDAQVWTTAKNLSRLARTLEFNLKAGLHLLVLDAGLVPYAAHPLNTLKWTEEFAADFAALGAFVREMGMRIAIRPGVPFSGPGSYPDYYEYAATVLGAMGLGEDARIPTRPGDPEKFYEQFDIAPPEVRRRLAVLNDDVWTIVRCCEISRECGVPIMYDHYYAGKEGIVADLLDACARTWRKNDGLPLVRFSLPGKDADTTAPTIDARQFLSFLTLSRPLDLDILVDFADGERSAMIAMIAAFEEPRLVPKRRCLHAAGLKE